MNHLWLIQRHDYDYDEAIGFVIAALTAKEAREIASEHHRDEGMGPWLDRTRSTCRKIGETSLKSGVVLQSDHDG